MQAVALPLVNAPAVVAPRPQTAGPKKQASESRKSASSTLAAASGILILSASQSLRPLDSLKPVKVEAAAGTEARVAGPPAECPICPAAAAEPKNERRKKTRKSNQIRAWYSAYGYAGPPYCKRCSEAFNNHLLHGNVKRNRAGCSREQPCAPCSRILAHVADPKQLFASLEQRRGGKKRASSPKAAADQQNAAPNKPKVQPDATLAAVYEAKPAAHQAEQERKAERRREALRRSSPKSVCLCVVC